MRFFSIVLMLLTIGALPAGSQEIVITNLDRFSPATPTFQRFSAFQWFAVGFTTDGSSYELDSVQTVARATTVSASIVAELRVADPQGGPGALVQSFSLMLGNVNVHLPDGPAMLSPNTTYFFSLGYPMGNATISDWFTSETDLSADGPAMIEQPWVSSSQGASWATGGAILTGSRFLFEVVPEPCSSALSAAALLCVALLRGRRSQWFHQGRSENARRSIS